MDRHGRPAMKRAPTSGSLSGQQLYRESGALATVSRDPGSPVSRRTSRESRRAPSVTPLAPEERPFACPYAKYDAETYSHRNVNDQEYRNCSVGYWTSIARLKQHLYRTHDRALRCCERCWQNFPNEDQLQKHRTTRCEARPMPVEKMDADQHQAVKERVQGKPKESWYKIYTILFPDDDPPASPYAEWVTGQDLRNCFRLLQHRLPALLFQEAITRQPQARELRHERDTPFPTTTELIERALLQCQREFGERTGLAHVFLIGPPSPIDSAGSDAERASVSPALIRPNPDLAMYQVPTRPRSSAYTAEDSDTSDEMDVDATRRRAMYSRQMENVPYLMNNAAYPPVSEEDILQTQYIQSNLYQNPEYDWS